MKNTLTIKPLIDNGLRVEYMVGHLDTSHGMYYVSVSEALDGGFIVTLNRNFDSKKGVVYIKTFPAMRHVMDAILTFVEDDERFSKVAD